MIDIVSLNIEVMNDLKHDLPSKHNLLHLSLFYGRRLCSIVYRDHFQNLFQRFFSSEYYDLHTAVIKVTV